jgi:hypothetical protein
MKLNVTKSKSLVIKSKITLSIFFNIVLLYLDHLKILLSDFGLCQCHCFMRNAKEMKTFTTFF